MRYLYKNLSLGVDNQNKSNVTSRRCGYSFKMLLFCTHLVLFCSFIYVLVPQKGAPKEIMFDDEDEEFDHSGK